MMKINTKNKISIFVMFSVIVILTLMAFYNHKAQENLNRRVEQEVTRKYYLSKYFRGTKFTYKSTTNQIKQNGMNVQVSNSISLHIFDFSNMTVTSTSHMDGKLQETTYNINDYSKDPDLVSTHILKIDSLGLKEIRLNSEGHTIEYYYNNGKVFIYKDIAREVSYDLVSSEL